MTEELTEVEKREGRKQRKILNERKTKNPSNSQPVHSMKNLLHLHTV